jgi:competence ComEA-like helix-hairpin-helix protein
MLNFSLYLYFASAMNKLRHLVTDYLSFSKKERVAMVLLTVVLLILTLLPFLNRQHIREITPVESGFAKAAANLNKTETEPDPGGQDDNADQFRFDRTESSYTPDRPLGKLFKFDPNTLPESGFRELGLRDRTISTLVNYRNKGGQFRKPEDLGKIYGLRRTEYLRLLPYVIITPINRTKFTSKNDDGSEQNYQRSTYKPNSAPKAIDINKADTTDFKTLYGIGSRLAARIVNFRNKLGGFYAIEQVGETYGVADSTFRKIRSYLIISDPVITKLNLNTAGYEALNAHPYISGKLAYLIIRHRRENGNFSTIDEIVALVAQTNDSFHKLKNYLEL